MITTPDETDGDQICEIAARSDLFNAEEVQCVKYIWQQYLQLGIQTSGYTFFIEKIDGFVLGFVCFGPRPLTDRVYDLYWIAVDPAAQRKGIGRRLIEKAEDAVRASGGRLLVIETSGSTKYAGTRDFYAASGYELEATLRDLYADGDDLCIYTRRMDAIQDDSAKNTALGFGYK